MAVKTNQKKKTFEVVINELAFFHEPWLWTPEEKSYRYDKVPLKVKRAFAEHLRQKGRMSPDEARMIVDWVREIKR